LLNDLRRSRLIGLTALIIVGAATLPAQAYVAVVAAAAILVTLAASEDRRPAENPHRKPTPVAASRTSPSPRSSKPVRIGHPG
jgi:hypothetical protein